MEYTDQINDVKERKYKLMLDSNLKRLRNERLMSQEMLADMLHIKRQTVSSYETGRSLPDIFILIEMADIFGVTLDELVGRNVK